MTQQKTALITGAGSGIGRALALEAVRRGYAPILVGRTEGSLLETQELFPGTRAVIVVADVTSPEGRRSIAGAVGQRLDVLINNAGTLSVGHLGDMDDAALAKTLDAKVTNIIIAAKNPCR